MSKVLSELNLFGFDEKKNTKKVSKANKCVECLWFLSLIGMRFFLFVNWFVF